MPRPGELVAKATSVYGAGSVETMLRKAGKGYVLGVAANHVFHSWSQKQAIGGTAAEIARIFPKAPGGACRSAKEAKVRACTIGPISNWPTSMQTKATAA